MSDSQQSSLRFPLEEDIWFKSGQEVEELVSISLDPHITIHDADAYVQLKGTLQLAGEYIPCSPGGSIPGEEPDIFSGPVRKYVQAIEQRSENEYHFIHFFPVDITIPKRRISGLDDMDVSIYAFDYTMPENACLRLQAEIQIQGLIEEEPEAYSKVSEETGSEEECEREDVTMSSKEEPGNTEFSELTAETNDAKHEAAAEESVLAAGMRQAGPSLPELDDDTEEVSNPSVNPKTEFLAAVERAPETEPSADEIETKQLEPINRTVQEALADEEEEYENELYEPFTAEVKIKTDAAVSPQPTGRLSESGDEAPPEAVLAGSYRDEGWESSSSKFAGDYAESSSSSESLGHSNALEMESSSKESVQKKPKKKKDKYTAISFADFFARKSEDTSAKMKVCFVQQGDSIEILADKYEVSTQQLMRANHLDPGEDLYEGQVLYIPAKQLYR